MPDFAPSVAPPWPDAIEVTRVEVRAFVDDVRDGMFDDAPSACEGWSVRDVTAHVAATFTRFDAMLRQGRAGDFTPPFAPDALDAENARAVLEFDARPSEAVLEASEAFLGAVRAPDEPVPHQLGTVPVGLQVLFGLLDVSLHHDDVLLASDRRYRPSSAGLEALDATAQRLYGLPAGADDPWALIVAGSGRRALP